MRTLRSALTSLGRSPVKASAMLATVGLGIAVLIFALSISTATARLVDERLGRGELVVTVRVTVKSATARRLPSSPSEYRREVTDALSRDIAGAVAVSPTESGSLSSFMVGQDTYQVRGVIGASEAYLDVMRLELIAGREPAAGSPDVLISESLADVLFGSPVAALGQPMQTAKPRLEIRGEVTADDIRTALPMALYTVRGVFADPDELRRRVYDIADMMVPLRHGPVGRTRTVLTTSWFVARVTDSRLATVESQVRSALAARFGEELTVEVWEGGTGMGFQLESLRSTVRIFSLVVNLLGVLLMAAGSVGLLSIMAVEALSRSREIALSRAFGAAKAMIAREFFARSLIMVGAASVLGVALSLFLSAPLTDVVRPVFRGMTGVELTGPVITPAAIVPGVAASLGIGGLLGTLPVVSALSAPIAEGIRDQ